MYGHRRQNGLERAYEHKSHAEIDVALAQRIERLRFFGVIHRRFRRDKFFHRADRETAMSAESNAIRSDFGAALWTEHLSLLEIGQRLSYAYMGRHAGSVSRAVANALQR